MCFVMVSNSIYRNNGVAFICVCICVRIPAIGFCMYLKESRYHLNFPYNKYQNLDNLDRIWWAMACESIPHCHIPKDIVSPSPRCHRCQINVEIYLLWFYLIRFYLKGFRSSIPMLIQDMPSSWDIQEIEIYCVKECS